jgi:hypothetical protein
MNNQSSCGLGQSGLMFLAHRMALCGMGIVFDVFQPSNQSTTTNRKDAV